MITKMFSKQCLQIELVDLYQYLELDGWVKDRGVKDKFNVYTKMYDGDEFDVIVPCSKDFRDYELRIQSTIKTLSELEDIDNDEIIKRIKNVNMDIVKIRFISEEYEDGSIPISVANSITSFLYDRVIYSASIEEKRRLKYYRVSNHAKEFADKFRFGQTQKGSFIVSLETKIQSDIKPLTLNLDDCNGVLDIDPPFERKIVSRINKTLTQLNKLDISKDSDIFEKCELEGISMNICETLASLQGIADDLSIEYTFELTSAVPYPNNLSPKVTINNQTIDKASKVFTKFKALEKEKREPIKTDVKVDKVTSMDKGGDVFVSFKYTGDNKKHTAKLNLERDDFVKACEALINPNCQFQLEGTLDKTTKNWIIDDVKVFIQIN